MDAASNINMQAPSRTILHPGVSHKFVIITRPPDLLDAQTVVPRTTSIRQVLSQKDCELENLCLSMNSLSGASSVGKKFGIEITWKLASQSLTWEPENDAQEYHHFSGSMFNLGSVPSPKLTFIAPEKWMGWLEEDPASILLGFGFEGSRREYTGLPQVVHSLAFCWKSKPPLVNEVSLASLLYDYSSRWLSSTHRIHVWYI